MCAGFHHFPLIKDYYPVRVTDGREAMCDDDGSSICLKQIKSFVDNVFAESVERDAETVRRVVREMRLHVPLAGVIDKAAETERVQRELDKLAKQLRSLEGKLGNQKFRERAAPEVVAEAEAQHEVVVRRREQLEQILGELAS